MIFACLMLTSEFGRKTEPLLKLLMRLSVRLYDGSGHEQAINIVYNSYIAFGAI